MNIKPYLTPTQIAEAMDAEQAGPEAPKNTEQAGPEDANPQKIEGMLGKILRGSLDKYFQTAVMELADVNNKVLVKWLTNPSDEILQDVAQLITAKIMESGIKTATEEAVSIPILNKLAGAGMAKIYKMFSGTKLCQNLQKIVAGAIKKSLMPGGIPDAMSSKNKLLKSFDLPDSLAAKLDDNQRINLIKILLVLRNKQELFDTEWNVLDMAGGGKSQNGNTK